MTRETIQITGPGCTVESISFNAIGPSGERAKFYLRERDTIGWVPLDLLGTGERPSKVAGFDPSVEESTDDSGWRTWEADVRVESALAHSSKIVGRW